MSRIFQHLLTTPVLAVALILATAPAPAGAAARTMRILHHEPVSVAYRTDSAGTRELSFDAYGRRFVLDVEPNERIAAAAGTRRDVEPLRGTVEGAPGSWVRITRGGAGRWHGMVFDGRDLYAIEPAAALAGDTVQPLGASGSTPVVFRLSDAVLPLAAAFCGTVDNTDVPAATVPGAASAATTAAATAAAPAGTMTALDAYRSLAAELADAASPAVANATAAPTLQVATSVIGDYEFATFTFPGGASPEEAIAARMNIVDGIFSAQVGVKVTVTLVTLFRDPADPFAAADAGSLLDELRRYRGSSADQLARGVTHLFTGRDLTGDTVGIAFIGTLCGGSAAVSLSEGVRSTTTAALVAAHEIGHNFGAPHDAETGSACASTPSTFLMAPRLNGSSEFSACSLQQITPVVSAARCLTAITPPDVGIDLGGAISIAATTGTPFTLSFGVRATGSVASTGVTVTANVPSALTAGNGTAEGGTCASGAGTITCSLGTVQPGISRRVDLTLTAPSAGAQTVSLSLASDIDSTASNNSAQVTVNATAPAVASGGGGGGGGGAFGALGLLGLAAARAFGRIRS